MALRSYGRRVGDGGGWRRRVGLVVDHLPHLLLLVTAPTRVCDLLCEGDPFTLLVDFPDGAFPWLVAVFSPVPRSLLADAPDITSSD
jgi:hypothetical protein